MSTGPAWVGCLFCGGNSAEPDHAAACDGRQGRVEHEEAEASFSALGHPQWAAIRQYIRIEIARPDVGPNGYGRSPRLEIIEPDDRPTWEWLRSVRIACAHCAAIIEPVRVRDGGWESSFFVVSCRQEISPGCSRSADTALMIAAIIADLSGRPPIPTPRYLDGLTVKK